MLIEGRAQPELHTLDPDSGRWDEIELPPTDRLALANVQHLLNVGWLLTGSQSGEEHRQAVAYLNNELTSSWATLRRASDGDRTSVHEAAITDGELHLVGSEDGQPTIWAIPTEHLPSE